MLQRLNTWPGRSPTQWAQTLPLSIYSGRSPLRSSWRTKDLHPLTPSLKTDMDFSAISILHRTSATKWRPGGCKIRDKILYCSESLKQAAARDSDIQDARMRFQAWHTNYTAGRAATPSLDEHLRDAPDVRAATLKSLQDLVTAFKCGTFYLFRGWDPCSCSTCSHGPLLFPLYGRQLSSALPGLETLRLTDTHRKGQLGRPGVNAKGC